MGSTHCCIGEGSDWKLHVLMSTISPFSQRSRSDPTIVLITKRRKKQSTRWPRLPHGFYKASTLRLLESRWAILQLFAWHRFFTCAASHLASAVRKSVLPPVAAIHFAALAKDPLTSYMRYSLRCFPCCLSTHCCIGEGSDWKLHVSMSTI